MTSPQRIVFIDVDGTILEHGAVIAPSTVDAIGAARARGHLVYLCTGRSEGQVFPTVREIGFDGEVTNSGAFATIGEETVIAHPMPRDDVDRLVAYFEANDVHYFLQSRVEVYSSPGIVGFTEDFFRERRAQLLDDLRRMGVPEQPMPTMNFLPMAQANLDEIAKAVFITTTEDGLERAEATLGDRFHVVPGSIPIPGGPNGEINLLGVNKGAAILELLEQWGRDVADTIGVGDSWNDVEMFDVVGTSVAMGNAAPEVQARADIVTTDVLDDGVWNAFVKLGLIEG